MSHGPVVAYDVSLAAAASASAGVRFDRSHSKVVLAVGTFSTAAEIYLEGSYDDSSYFQIYHKTPNTAAAEANAVLVKSGLSTSGAFVELPQVSVPYMRIHASAAASSAATCKLLCSD